ncbi:MAG: hypothetical protein M1840_005828 [Geoglossum simile]|nr:MAG: hypothetical protein M1840_005828 [Geoglossum simile]
MDPSPNRQLDLFGGAELWRELDWVASDDRVRGGKSQSYFDCPPSFPSARFHGSLDIQTLGGAGFASQCTSGKNLAWDLSAYGGMQLTIDEADDKTYTLVLKDTLLPDQDGRRQSTVSYGFDFCVNAVPGQLPDTEIYVPWDQLKATYRGREVHAPPLNITDVKRFGLMMRSFFGSQQGTFSLKIRSISAVSKPTGPSVECGKLTQPLHYGIDRATTQHRETK